MSVPPSSPKREGKRLPRTKHVPLTKHFRFSVTHRSPQGGRTGSKRPRAVAQSPDAAALSRRVFPPRQSALPRREALPFSFPLPFASLPCPRGRKVISVCRPRGKRGEGKRFISPRRSFLFQARWRKEKERKKYGAEVAGGPQIRPAAEPPRGRAHPPPAHVHKGARTRTHKDPPPPTPDSRNSSCTASNTENHKQRI